MQVGDAVLIIRDIEDEGGSIGPVGDILVRAGTRGIIKEATFAPEHYVVECQLSNGTSSWVGIYSVDLKLA